MKGASRPEGLPVTELATFLPFDYNVKSERARLNARGKTERLHSINQSFPRKSNDGFLYARA